MSCKNVEVWVLSGELLSVRASCWLMKHRRGGLEKGGTQGSDIMRT